MIFMFGHSSRRVVEIQPIKPAVPSLTSHPSSLCSSRLARRTVHMCKFSQHMGPPNSSPDAFHRRKRSIASYCRHAFCWHDSEAFFEFTITASLAVHLAIIDPMGSHWCQCRRTSDLMKPTESCELMRWDSEMQSITADNHLIHRSI